MAEAWIKLSRNCEAVQIPYANPLTLPEGTEVVVTLSTSASFTVETKSGFLARIDAMDADALGMEPPAPEAMVDRRHEPYDEAKVWDALKTCYDPEIPANIVDLGLIHELKTEPLKSGGRCVEIGLMLTAPGCGMGDFLKEEIEAKVSALPGVSVAQVKLVLDPPWDPSRMSEAARLAVGLF